MADSLSSPPSAPQQPNPQSGPPNSLSIQPDPPPPSSNPNFNLPLPPPPPPPQQPPSAAIPPPSIPSFRPLLPQPLQFSPSPIPGSTPNLTYQNPPAPTPAMPTTPMQPNLSYQVPPFQHQQQPIPAPRPFAPFPNGFSAAPPPAGIPRYPPPYGTMIRPVYPPRPPGAVNVLSVPRPLVGGIPTVRPFIPPVVRPVVVPSVTPAEMPQTPVYVGKIAPTVENEFMLSLLQLCGPIKSWKRPQDLPSGTPKGFGFYEFESAEGILRALRLLNKLNVDGQELMINVNQAMKEYLERYVQRKSENSKKNETQATGVEKDDGGAEPPDVKQDAKPDAEHSNKEDVDSKNKESHDVANFGIVTDEDREADLVALEKITKMIEERLKTRPSLPPPPAQPTGDGSEKLTSEKPSKTRDEDSDVDIDYVAAEDKNEKETNSDDKLTSEHDRPETPDRRRLRERDRDKDLKQEKQRELERYEREAERERVRRERGQRRRTEVAESQYEAHLKDWEYREREKEKERQHEKEKEKEMERKRRKQVLHDEEGEDGDSRKRWHRRLLEEKRKKRLREKEDDLLDRQKEAEEIAEAKKRTEEDQQQKQQTGALKLLSEHVVSGVDEIMATEEIINEVKSIVAEQDTVADYNCEGLIGDGNALNGINNELAMPSVASTDAQSSGNAPTKKLGFGLVGSGKRTTVPSVFREEDDDDAHKDKKMRPLVPIDYSTEELQAVQPTVPGPAPSNLAAAAEFAKRISNANHKEEKLDGERDRSRRSNDKSSRRDRDRGDEDGTRNRDEKERFPVRERDRDHGLEKHKTSDNRKLLDAKQLIDMIPKTKEELFSYEIDWAVYEKHQLHERMRPWISKKIIEFLGEEENTLIDYIVSTTQEHVKASQMLELLQGILDEEAEMFVLKMWRMLIFEIKRVETGLASRS